MNRMKGNLFGIWQYMQNTHVRANRVDVRFVDHKAKQVWAVEITCPSIDNRAKVEEKAIKYCSLLLTIKTTAPWL